MIRRQAAAAAEPLCRAARLGPGSPTDDEGAGGVLAVAMLVGLCAAGLALASVSGAVAAHQRLVGASDSAALAAADTASGRVAGEPCDRASEIAAALAVRLAACAVSPDGSVTVTTNTEILGVTVAASARAGPPP